MRADSGFWNTKIMARLQAAGWSYSIGVRQQPHVKAAITAITEQDRQTLEDYPDAGEAQIAQTMHGPQRLIVRHTRLVGDQAELWPDWRHFAFLTNRTDALKTVESEHRQHAVVELAIRDLKDQALAHFPSGKFLANAAWTVIAALAHNLLRWTSLIGLPDTIIPTARTLRPARTPSSPESEAEAPACRTDTLPMYIGPWAADDPAFNATPRATPTSRRNTREHRAPGTSGLVAKRAPGRTR